MAKVEYESSFSVGRSVDGAPIMLTVKADGKLECSCRKKRDNGIWGDGCQHAALFEAVAYAMWKARVDVLRNTWRAFERLPAVITELIGKDTVDAVTDLRPLPETPEAPRPARMIVFED